MTEPTMIAFIEPKRSAKTPAIGWPTPHKRFCSANESAKTERDQCKSSVIGVMNKPRLCRIPRLMVSRTQAAISSRTIIRELIAGNNREALEPVAVTLERQTPAYGPSADP